MRVEFQRDASVNVRREISYPVFLDSELAQSKDFLKAALTPLQSVVLSPCAALGAHESRTLSVCMPLPLAVGNIYALGLCKLDRNFFGLVSAYFFFRLIKYNSNFNGILYVVR